MDDSWFEKYLPGYSEITVNPNASSEVLDSVRNYQQTIQQNNASSIYNSANYCLNWTNTTPSMASNLPGPSIPPMFPNEPVVYAPYGRGPLGQNFCYTFGGKPIGMSEEDYEVYKQIRMGAPFGFGNEVTENAVREHHMRQRALATEVSPTSENMNLPVLSNLNPNAECFVPRSALSTSSSHNLGFYNRPFGEIQMPEMSAEGGSFYNTQDLAAALPTASVETIPINELLRLNKEQLKERARSAMIEKQMRMEEVRARRRAITEVLSLTEEEKEMLQMRGRSKRFDRSNFPPF